MIGDVYCSRDGLSIGYFMAMRRQLTSVVISPLFGWDDYEQKLSLVDFKARFRLFYSSDAFAPVLQARFDKARIRLWRKIVSLDR